MRVGDCSISDNTILITISLFTELWKGWCFFMPVETYATSYCLLVCSEERSYFKKINKMRHGQNNLASEMKPKGRAFQAYENK